MSEDKPARPWPRVDYGRHDEFSQDPPPRFWATYKRLLARHSRASGAEREQIGLEIDILVAEEQARQEGEARPAPPRTPGRRRMTQAEFWHRYREAAADAAPYPSDLELADKMGYSDDRWFRELVKRHGRPPDD
jgi:hypothetical protein